MSFFNSNQTDFFAIFEQGVSFSLEAARTLQTAFADGVINQEELGRIKKIEHDGDHHVHRCLKLLEAAFITPIDRSDILDIVKHIENITDSVDSVAERIHMMHIVEVDRYMIKLVDLSVEACVQLVELMQNLAKFRKNIKRINELIISINHIEETGDKLFMEAMRALFEPGTDPVTIIKKRDVYEQLETILDNCEDVADAVEKVLIAKT